MCVRESKLSLVSPIYYHASLIHMTSTICDRLYIHTMNLFDFCAWLIDIAAAQILDKCKSKTQEVS